MSSCNTFLHQPMQPAQPRLGAWSTVHGEMASLPVPREKIVAAVYQFRDQTGQYKPSETGAGWSTAVTQGATSILLQSLDESGWFVPIEREGLSNLLNERRIIRSSREQYEGAGQGENLLPPLLFGGITLEGGIISYESNTVTGGAGLRYFGAGASGEYRENKVTVYLRAVSTSTGRILKNVHTSKTILSQKISAGLFRFVSLKKLVEAETGFTYNEPAHMAVQEAIDKAVFALIVEGMLDGLWAPMNAEDMEHPSIKAYLEERDTNDLTDYLGFTFDDDLRGNFSMEANASMTMYDGDYPNAMVMPAAGISLGFWQHKPVSLSLDAGVGRVEARDIFHANLAHAGVGLTWRFFSNFTQGSPFMKVGGGVMYYDEDFNIDSELDFNRNLIPFVDMGFGYEWLLGNRGSVSLSMNNRQLLSDEIDSAIHGRYNDRVWSVNMGIKLYMNILRSRK